MTMDPFIEYDVTTRIEASGFFHVGAAPVGYEPSEAPHFSWDTSIDDPDSFNLREARRFFGVICGMNEETRDAVCDKIEFDVAKLKRKRARELSAENGAGGTDEDPPSDPLADPPPQGSTETDPPATG